MTDTDAIVLMQKALWITMVVSGPIVVSAMIIGTVVAFVQALTQVQEATLTFVPKMLAAMLILSLTANYSGALLTAFTQDVYAHIEVSGSEDKAASFASVRGDTIKSRR